MNKQVKLTENELRQMINEAVHQTLVNEDNFMTRMWNRNKINNLKNRINYSFEDYQEAETPEEKENALENIDWLISKLNQYDKKSAQQFSAQRNQMVNSQDEESNGANDNEEIATIWDNSDNQPYDYNPQPIHTITPNQVNMDDWNQENYGNDEIDVNEPETGQQPQSFDNQEVGQNTEPQAEPEENQETEQPNQPQTAPQQQAPQQPQQPAYKRGEKYHVAFSQDNEDMFNNHITPTYNNLNNVIKSLGALREIGEHNYNQASSIFGYWGQNNYNGGQPAFKAVCQQIDSIMPTLQSLKKEMKNVLMANGVRDSEDYQHFNMEEQKMRKIISNSIKKVLQECKNKK